MTPYSFTWTGGEKPEGPGEAEFHFPNGTVRLSLRSFAEAYSLDSAVRHLQRQAFLEGRQSIVEQINVLKP